MKQLLIPIVLSAMLCAGLVYLSHESRPLPDLGKLAPFEFESADGGELTPADLTGKVSVWSFFFTSCEGPCPLLETEVAKLHKALEKVQFISVTIDPEHDTAEKLTAYRSKLGGSNQGWIMARPEAEKTSVDAFAAEVFHLGVEAKELIHSTKLVLVDQAGIVRGLYDSTDQKELEQLKSDAASLLQ